MADDDEIEWHKEQIAKNRAVLEELEAGNTSGGDVFPETQSEIDRIKAQIAQSELIVAAHEKQHPENERDFLSGNALLQAFSTLAGCRRNGEAWPV